jgi:hypothetical protein
MEEELRKHFAKNVEPTTTRPASQSGILGIPATLKSPRHLLHG